MENKLGTARGSLVFNLHAHFIVERLHAKDSSSVRLDIVRAVENMEIFLSVIGNINQYINFKDR